MERLPISQDDLIDVLEMSNGLEKAMASVLEGNAHNLALSALMTATINCMLGQCKTLNEVLYYRSIFVSMLDVSINSIKIENPPTS